MEHTAVTLAGAYELALASSIYGYPCFMLILGIILIVVGLLVPKLAVLFTIGLILGIIGLVLLVLGQAGHAVGGRRWY